MLLLRQRRSDQDEGRKRREISTSRWNRGLAAASATPVSRMFAREATNERRGVRDRAKRRCFAGNGVIWSALCVCEENQDRRENRGMREQRGSLGARRPQRFFEPQQMNRRAVRRRRL